MTATTSPAQSPATSPVTTLPLAAPRQLDARGGHWETHGRDVPLIARHRHGTPLATVSVHSQRSPQHYGGVPHVTLGCSADPFAVSLRLSPQDAFSLAAQIVDAATAAREIERTLAGEGLPA